MVERGRHDSAIKPHRDVHALQAAEHVERRLLLDLLHCFCRHVRRKRRRGRCCCWPRMPLPHVALCRERPRDGEPEEEGWGADLVDEDLVEVPKEYPEPAREVGKVVAAGNQEAAKTC